jgi:fibronectin type 3 domain-containing protein
MGTGVQTATHSVDLSWIASTTPGVSYNVYRGSQTGGPYTKLNGTPIVGTAYTDTTVLSGLKYFYVVTAVDSSNIESVYSNEVPASIP